MVVGSRVEELQQLALSICKAAIEQGIRVEPEWLPREENQLADYLRIVDYDDLGINKEMFRWLDRIWGPHSVDRFAKTDRWLD